MTYRVFNLYMAMCHAMGCNTTKEGLKNFARIMHPYVR